MKSFLAKALRFLVSEQGPTAVEYAAMLMLVFLVCLSAVIYFGQQTQTSLGRSATAIDRATNAAE
jgi:pilus assembly protein Flp/PilA